MPSIIGNSTIGNLIGRTGPTGPTGSIGPAGLRGAIGITSGPTGATGVWIINAVSDLVSSGITFELSNGTILGPLYGFTGPTGSYSDSRGVSLQSGAAYYSGFSSVVSGKTFEFRGICGGGNIAATLSSDGSEILLTISPITDNGVYGTTAANFVVYTTDTFTATTTRIGITGSSSVLSFGLTADNGATGSSIKVYSEFVEPSYTLQTLFRNATTGATNDIVLAVDSGGYTIKLDKYSVYQLNTPIGITAFTTSADNSVLQSYTLFVNGQDVWNFPSNVYFENTDKGIGKYGFLEGMNIVHMWSENGGLTFNAAFVDRGIGKSGTFYSDPIGSCCLPSGFCQDNATSSECDTLIAIESGGVFTPLASCIQVCGRIGYCCSQGTCYDNSNEDQCNEINGVFSTTPCTDCGVSPSTGACCDAETCTDGVLPANCTGGKTFYSGLVCSDPSVVCAPVLGCCINKDACIINNNISQTACFAKGSGYIWTANATCTTADCTSGVCCVTTSSGSKSCSPDETQISCNAKAINGTTTVFYPNTECADIDCSNPPPPVLGACCNGSVCTETIQSNCTGTWNSTKRCSDAVPPCVVPVYTYSFTVLNADGSPVTDIILPDSTPQETEFKITVSTTDPAGVRLQLPSTHQNTLGHVFTITQTYNGSNYIGGLLPNGATVTIKISTTYDEFGRKNGIENTINAVLLDSLLNTKFSQNINFYVVSKPPVPIDGCDSCEGGSLTDQFKVQSQFIINRLCMDCAENNGSYLEYPPVKTQKGLVNFCVSKNGSCGWNVNVDCITYGPIEEVWDCKNSYKASDDCVHAEYGVGVWQGNRPTTCASGCDPVQWNYLQEIKTRSVGCFNQKNPATPSCKGLSKVFAQTTQSGGSCPGYVLDPYFSQIDFIQAPLAIANRGIKQDQQKQILNDLQTAILNQTDNNAGSDNALMAFNPDKVNTKVTINTSELSCCAGNIVFGSLSNGGEILNLGFNAPAGKTVKYLLWMNKLGGSMQRASECGQPDFCGVFGALCQECRSGFTAEHCWAGYNLNISRVVFNNSDKSIDTTLSCSDNLFSTDTRIGFSYYYKKNKTWGDDTNCVCKEVEGQPDILTGSPCPDWSLYLLGELKESDLIKTTVGDKTRYDLQRDTISTEDGCQIPIKQWEKTCDTIGATSQPWESEWWKYIAFNCLKPVYSQFNLAEFGSREDIYFKFMDKMFRGRHCDTGTDLSCYPPNSCLLFGQYGSYSNCYCDDILNQPIPVNLFGENLTLDINGVNTTQPNKLEYSVMSYQIIDGGRNPQQSSVVLDLGYNPTIGPYQYNRELLTTAIVPGTPDYPLPFPFANDSEFTKEYFGVVANAHIPAGPALLGVPTISVDAVWNREGYVDETVMPFGTMLPKVKSGLDTTGGREGVFFNILPNLEKLFDADNNRKDVLEFKAEAWLLKPDFSGADYKSVEGTEYVTNPLENILGFVFNFPGIDTPAWYKLKGTDTKIYKFVFKLTAKTLIGFDWQGQEAWRTITKIFAYNHALSGNSTFAPTTQFSNKVLDGTCVSLDCSQVQVLCDSLPDC